MKCEVCQQQPPPPVIVGERRKLTLTIRLRILRHEPHLHSNDPMSPTAESDEHMYEQIRNPG